MNKSKKLLSAALALVLCLSLLSATVLATETNGLPLRSSLDWDDADDFGAYDYAVSRPKTGYAMGYYVIDNGDGTVSSLVVPPAVQSYDWETEEFYFTGGTEFYVERYDVLGNVVSSKTLPKELPTFGAFLAGQDYYYIAFGQNNERADDSREVWRIVQYDKDWNRLAYVSVNGGDSYTTEPFRSAVARMAESADGQSLALYAARTRYDGHQSNITFLMGTEPFHLKQLMGDAFPANHVSHSFGQFVRYDGDNLVTVDHGDAYPRSFVLQSEGAAINLLDIYGDVGDNVTNAIGSGFEVSDNGYLFLGCSDAQTGAETPWNVFLTYVDKNAIGNAPASMSFGNITVSTGLQPSGSWFSLTRKGITYYVTGLSPNADADEITQYVDRFIAAITPSPSFTWLTRSDTTIDCARLVRIDGNTFVAMWKQADGIHWRIIDGQGRAQGEEKIIAGVPIPPTQPIVREHSILWIQVVDDAPHLFTLDIDAAGLVPPPNPDDFPSSWAADAVNQAKSAGIVPEALQTKYTQSITRAEYCSLATALYENINGAITKRKTFSDTTDPNVEKMAAIGVVNGTGGNNFSPDEKLTREQAATMLSRLAEALGKPFADRAPTFADNGTISEWAFAAVGKVQANGIMQGVGSNNFSPKTDYTREQSIITMVRMMEYAK